jgi:DTW domain-containing protein YfiP
MQERKSEQPPRGEGKWKHGEVELAGREALEVASTYEAKLASIKGKHQYCSTCWLPLPVCCCQTLSAEQKSALQTLQERQPVEISLYMHVKEFLRKSNTGALIQCAHPLLPTSIYIAGYPPHEEELQRRILRPHTACCVVFPSSNSVSINAFVAADPNLHGGLEIEMGGGREANIEPQKKRETQPAIYNSARRASHADLRVGEEEEEGGGGSVTLWAGGGQASAARRHGVMAIFVEGTWSQARRLEKRLPANLQRVTLDLTAHLTAHHPPPHPHQHQGAHTSPASPYTHKPALD